MKNSLLFLLLSSALQADITVSSRYVAGGETTETTSYSNASRQRFDSQGAVIIQQCDRKRLLELDNDAKSYSVLPATPPAPPKTTCTGTPQSAFTGEEKEMHGIPVKHWVSSTACSPTDATEIDGWFASIQPPAACSMAQLGPGLPLQYTMRTRDAKGVTEITYEATSVSTKPIPAAMFEPPAGFSEVDITKALAVRNPEYKKAVEAPKTTGTIRVGVANFSNRSGHTFNTQSFEAKIASAFKSANVETVPLGLGSEAEVIERARKANADYVLLTDIMQISKTESGGVAKKLGKLSRMASGGPAKETYAANLNYKLVPSNGGEPLTSSVTGNSSAFSLRDAVNLARTVSQFAMPMLMMNQMFRNGAMANILNNPAAMNQMGGYGGMGAVDPGLGAWNSAFSSMNFAAGVAGSDPDKDQQAAINEAIDKLAKSIVADNLRR